MLSSFLRDLRNLRPKPQPVAMSQPQVRGYGGRTSREKPEERQGESLAALEGGWVLVSIKGLGPGGKGR